MTAKPVIPGKIGASLTGLITTLTTKVAGHSGAPVPIGRIGLVDSGPPRS